METSPVAGSGQASAEGKRRQSTVVAPTAPEAPIYVIKLCSDLPIVGQLGSLCLTDAQQALLDSAIR